MRGEGLRTRQSRHAKRLRFYFFTYCSSTWRITIELVYIQIGRADLDVISCNSRGSNYYLDLVVQINRIKQISRCIMQP